MSIDSCGFDLPIYSSQLQLAVSRAFGTLANDAEDSLFAYLQFRSINLDNGSKHTLNQLVAALEPIFSKEAIALVMEMVWHTPKR